MVGVGVVGWLSSLFVWALVIQLLRLFQSFLINENWVLLHFEMLFYFFILSLFSLNLLCSFLLKIVTFIIMPTIFASLSIATAQELLVLTNHVLLLRSLLLFVLVVNSLLLLVVPLHQVPFTPLLVVLLCMFFSSRVAFIFYVREQLLLLFKVQGHLRSLLLLRAVGLLLSKATGCLPHSALHPAARRG